MANRTIQFITLISMLVGFSLPAYAGFQSLEEIRHAAEKFATDRFGQDENSTIETRNLDPRLKLQHCPTPLTTQALSTQNHSGNMTVLVKCQGVKPWTVYVPVKIKSYIEVAVAKRPLARGIPITDKDIVFEKREISRLGSGYFEDKNKLNNRLPKRTLAKGAVISPRDLGVNKVINKGSRVSIIAHTNGITVRMAGLALSDAGKGESIRVRNLSSKRTVDAVVIEPGLVKVPM